MTASADRTDGTEAAALLGVDEGDLEDVMEHFERREYEGREYRALPDSRHGIERGTVLVGDTAVRGFPSVPRTLVLDPGVERHFEGAARVTVEEKLDGYNVRIARLDDGEGGEATYAFTRSGYVCPYTTDRVRSLLDLDPFFDDHPETILCGEFVGPETPYTDHDYADVDSHAVRIFDIRERTSGDPLPVEERRDRCAEYDLPQPTLFGAFDPDETVSRVRQVVADLDVEGREGVVLRSSDGRQMLKYTTAAKHHDELEYAFHLPFDTGREFIFPRLVREGFQAVEWEEDDAELRERAHAIGEAMLLPMVDSIRAVRDGESVGREHTIRGDPDAIDALFDHFGSLGVNLRVEEDRIEGDERIVTFVKVSEATTDQIRAYLDGTTVDE